MATWHQRRNPAGLAALYRPEPGRWKCVIDKPDEFASVVTFDSKTEAEAYCAKTRATLVPPPEAAQL